MTAAGLAVRPVTAAEVMSSPPVTVSPDTTMWVAWSLMMDLHVRHLVVTRDGHCVGVLDDRSLFAQWPMGPLAMRRSTVAGILRRRTGCVLADAPVATVADLMVRDGVDAVPVVDDAGVVVGIVTTGDIAAAVARHGLHPAPEPAVLGPDA